MLAAAIENQMRRLKGGLSCHYFSWQYTVMADSSKGSFTGSPQDKGSNPLCIQHTLQADVYGERKVKNNVFGLLLYFLSGHFSTVLLLKHSMRPNDLSATIQQFMLQ